MTVGTPAAFASSIGPHEGAIVERREHEPVDALAGESLDHLHLLFAVVLAQRPFPGDRDVQAFGLQFTLGLDRAGVDAVPELGRRAFRDDSNGQGAPGLAWALTGSQAPAARTEQGKPGTTRPDEVLTAHVPASYRACRTSDLRHLVRLRRAAVGPSRARDRRSRCTLP